MCNKCEISEVVGLCGFLPQSPGVLLTSSTGCWRHKSQVLSCFTQRCPCPSQSPSPRTGGEARKNMRWQAVAPCCQVDTAGTCAPGMGQGFLCTRSVHEQVITGCASSPQVGRPRFKRRQVSLSDCKPLALMAGRS